MPTDPPDAALRGEVVYLYAFDVASEIRLDRAAELLSGRSTPFALRTDRPTPRSVPLSRPLAVEPPAPAARINGVPVRLLVRVYDVGVVSVTARVAFTCDALVALVPFHTPELDDGRPLDALARQQCDEVCRALSAALVRPDEPTEPEAYTAFTLTHFGDTRDANRWLADRGRAVAGLLAETPDDRLSDAQVAEVLRLRRSFNNTDLVVIDWDAALVVELDGSADDVLFVLELANLQLEEFRWMDRALDRYLERAYEDLGRRSWWSFGAMPSILRSLRRLRVDLAKLVDEVTHVTKFIGDWHLARVHLLARERFHLDQWRASVEQRLEELDRLYTITRGDLYDRRMLTLEIVIVVFFAIDLVILLVK
ncbi:MAG: hypothetical protein J0I06_09705 [Planctomycetes bacterium]|nr:hypothetical protein [Planctomycetota bacterium]